MPKRVLFAQACRADGVDTCSSAVLNFVPETALTFHAAFRKGDDAVCEALLRLLICVRAHPRPADRPRGVRDQGRSPVARLRGRACRATLTDLTAEEEAMLAELIRERG